MCFCVRYIWCIDSYGICLEWKIKLFFSFAILPQFTGLWSVHRNWNSLIIFPMCLFNLKFSIVSLEWNGNGEAIELWRCLYQSENKRISNLRWWFMDCIVHTQHNFIQNETINDRVLHSLHPFFFHWVRRMRKNARNGKNKMVFVRDDGRANYTLL